MTKESLLHYCELIDEVTDTARQIEKTKSDIRRIEKQISDIESGCMVKDKVYGGEGGWQGFVIEGVPIPEYGKLKIVLGNRKICLQNEIDTLCIRAVMLDNERTQVQEFISRLKDPQIRRIVTLRCINRLHWSEVAKKMGEGYTEEAVKKAFSRFLQNNL
mgnify:CR=1 FL=1